jgi:hypothetical protein
MRAMRLSVSRLVALTCFGWQAAAEIASARAWSRVRCSTRIRAWA